MHVVPKVKLQLLQTSKKLKKYLESAKLRKVIRSIDGAKNSRRTLDKHLLSDKAFKEFVDLML